VNDAATQSPRAGARLEIVDGSNAGRSAVADPQGHYVLTSLEAGTFSLRATADGHDPEVRQVTLASNLIADFSLRRSGPPPQPDAGVTGTALDGESDRALPDVLVRIDGLGETRTAADGTFRFDAAEPQLVRPVTLSSSSIVVRQTHLRVPGPSATLSLMPATTDLPAFDQMFRASGSLVRWVSAPALTVERRVLHFTSVSDQEYTAAADMMSDGEAQALVADLAWALPQMSAFPGFVDQLSETSPPGSRVAVSRPGRIVVARYAGLQAATGFWGYGRWQTAGGEVVSGIIMLDLGFDTSGSIFRRSLRAHELGHALGYNHVTLRDSVMNSSARIEPNPFDRSAMKLAFQRPPMNRSPDIDPDPFTVNLRGMAERVWHGDR
jgi:hypothetical protein